MSSIDHLLTPSLSHTKVLRPIYSTQAHFLVAFFGGPFGICLFGAHAVHQGGVLARFRFLYLALFVVAVLLSGFWAWTHAHGFPFELNETLREQDVRKWGHRLAGLAMMGLIYLAQRSVFSVSEMSGELPSAWKPGFIAVVAGWLANYIALFGWAYVIA